MTPNSYTYTKHARHLNGQCNAVDGKCPSTENKINLVVLLPVAVAAALACGILTFRFSAEPESNVLSEQQAEEASAKVDQGPSGWVKGDDGVSRYYDPNSHEFYYGWLNDGDDTFFFDKNAGIPHVGWLELGGYRYCFDDGSHGKLGSLLKNQWLTTDEGEHYLLQDGSASVGWKMIGDKWFFFDTNGVLKTGWIDDGSGKIYWVKPEDKTLPHHEWIEIDGIFQAFDDDGSWVDGGDIVPPNDAENVATMSSRQRAVVDACDVTPWPGRGYCAAWVSDVFANAGEPEVDGNACDIANAWCTSNDLNDLKPGMVIAVPKHSRTENGQIWGHVCIYAGNGLVRDSGGTSTRWVTLGSWFAWYGTLETPKWGWANGISLTDV